jgi:hypothetical protein
MGIELQQMEYDLTLYISEWRVCGIPKSGSHQDIIKWHISNKCVPDGFNLWMVSFSTCLTNLPTSGGDVTRPIKQGLLIQGCKSLKNYGQWSNDMNSFTGYPGILPEMIWVQPPWEGDGTNKWLRRSGIQTCKLFCQGTWLIRTHVLRVTRGWSYWPTSL